MSSTNDNSNLVIAFGFEQYGFEVEDGFSLDTEKSNIKFVNRDSDINLDTAHGVIVHSGIFERFTSIPGPYGGITVEYKKNQLHRRQKEVVNLLKKGGWVCCLLDEIIDSVRLGYNDRNCDNTDLVKFLLNLFSIGRRVIEGYPLVVSKNDEFNKVIDQYGIAKTILSIPYKIEEQRVLASIGIEVVGAEINKKVIFLPFHTTDKSSHNAIELTKELSRAVLDYLQKRRIEIPDWVNEFRFAKESLISDELTDLESKQKSLQTELKTYKEYKGILALSNDALKETVINIFKNFFSINVSDVENFKDDGIIRDDNGKELVVLEVKGTKKGIKREYISQLDINRDRIGLDISTPGVLIINEKMDTANIADRLNNSVSGEQIRHAKNNNILIIRTVELLYLMKSYEKESNRGEKFLELCFKSGGLLRADNENISII